MQPKPFRFYVGRKTHDNARFGKIPGNIRSVQRGIDAVQKAMGEQQIRGGSQSGTTRRKLSDQSGENFLLRRQGLFPNFVRLPDCRIQLGQRYFHGLNITQKEAKIKGRFCTNK